MNHTSYPYGKVAGRCPDMPRVTHNAPQNKPVELNTTLARYSNFPFRGAESRIQEIVADLDTIALTTPARAVNAQLTADAIETGKLLGALPKPQREKLARYRHSMHPDNFLIMLRGISAPSATPEKHASQRPSAFARIVAGLAGGKARVAGTPQDDGTTATKAERTYYTYEVDGEVIVSQRKRKDHEAFAKSGKVGTVRGGNLAQAQRAAARRAGNRGK